MSMRHFYHVSNEHIRTRYALATHAKRHSRRQEARKVLSAFVGTACAKQKAILQVD